MIPPLLQPPSLPPLHTGKHSQARSQTSFARLIGTTPTRTPTTKARDLFSPFPFFFFNFCPITFPFCIRCLQDSAIVCLLLFFHFRLRFFREKKRANGTARCVAHAHSRPPTHTRTDTGVNEREPGPGPPSPAQRGCCCAPAPRRAPGAVRPDRGCGPPTLCFRGASPRPCAAAARHDSRGPDARAAPRDRRGRGSGRGRGSRGTGGVPQRPRARGARHL